MTKYEYLQWGFNSRENFEKMYSDLLYVMKNNSKISTFDEAFEEICYMYGWKWKVNVEKIWRC